MSAKKEYSQKCEELLNRVEELAKHDKSNNQRYDLGSFDDFKANIKDLNNGKDLYEMLFDFYNASL